MYTQTSVRGIGEYVYIRQELENNSEISYSETLTITPHAYNRFRGINLLTNTLRKCMKPSLLPLKVIAKYSDRL